MRTLAALRAVSADVPPARRAGGSVAGGDPVNQAVANEVADLIRQSLGTLEPPRKWAQLQTAFELYRKASGQDRPQPKNNGRVLINFGARPRIREKTPLLEV